MGEPLHRSGAHILSPVNEAARPTAFSEPGSQFAPRGGPAVDRAGPTGFLPAASRFHSATPSISDAEAIVHVRPCGGLRDDEARGTGQGMREKTRSHDGPQSRAARSERPTVGERWTAQ